MSVAYGSRLLTKPEKRYCVTRRELLAVVTFTKQYRAYLTGRRFLQRTDHGSLTWLRNFKEPEGQLARWLERLQELDFEIVHRRGKRNTNADALSRLHADSVAGTLTIHLSLRLWLWQRYSLHRAMRAKNFVTLSWSTWYWDHFFGAKKQGESPAPTIWEE